MLTAFEELTIVESYGMEVQKSYATDYQSVSDPLISEHALA